MINISEYLTTQTPLPPFLPYPRFLLELDLSQTAKMTYVLLLDRATLSQKNLWIDERGFVFVIFTICSLAEQLGRSTVSVSIDIVKPLWWSKPTTTLNDTDLNYLMLYSHIKNTSYFPYSDSD